MKSLKNLKKFEKFEFEKFEFENLKLKNLKLKNFENLKILKNLHAL